MSGTSHGNITNHGMEKREIDHPNAHYLLAAQGWMELGDCESAIAELKQIDVEYSNHPMVLMVWWHTHARSKRWEVCIEVGRALTEVCPDSPFGWINLCNALYFQGKTSEAYNTLISVLERFPGNELLPYNRACYACQLSKLDEARNWLHEAFALGDNVELKLKAEEDPDLEALWEEIPHMH